MSKDSDSGVIKKQTTGEAAWGTFLSVLLKAKVRTKLRVPETLIAGWAAKKPTVIFTDEAGSLQKNKDVGIGFISDFLSFCPKVDSFPVCIGRQTSTFAIMDTKTAMTFWHKNIVVQKPVFIQRYVPQSKINTSLVRIIWKPDSMLFVTFTNVFPHNANPRRRSILANMHIPASVEDRFFTRADQANMSADLSNRDELESFTETLAGLYKRILNDQHQFVSEIVAEFTQDRKGDWYLLRVTSFEMTSNLQSSMPTLAPIRLKNRNWLRIDKSQYKHLSIKRMSQTILSLKQSLGLAITNDDRERLASYTDFSKKLMPKSPLPQVKTRKQKTTLNMPTPYLVLEPLSHSVSHLDMPPLFQFPTPRDSEDLNRSMPGPKLEEIKEFIRRQNNSMYMRIHYQEELSQERKRKQCTAQSLSFVAEEFDRLREKGVRGRVVLRSHEDEIYRGYSVA